MDEREEEQLELPDMYKKGFNQAYMFSQHLPEVVKGIDLPESPEHDPNQYRFGFMDGQKAFEREKRIEQLRERSGKAKDRGKDQGPDR